MHVNTCCLTPIRTTLVDPNGVSGAVDGVEFSKDGVYYAAGDNHGVARIYLTADGSMVGKVTHEYWGGICAHSAAEINAIAFSPDGQYLATGDGGNGGAKVWSRDVYLKQNDPMSQNTPGARTLISNTEVDGLDWSPDGKFIAIASDANVRIYDALDDFVQTFRIDAETRQGAVNSLDFSSDSAYLAYAGGGNPQHHASVFVYRTSDWTKMDQFASPSPNRNSIKSVRFSPDDRYLGLGSRGQLTEIWERENDDWGKWKHKKSLSHAGENQNALRCDDNDRNAAVEAVEWSSDGKYFLSGGLISGRLHLWATDTWTHLGYVQGQSPNRQIEYIDVFDDLVIAGGDDGDVRLFRFGCS